MPYRFKANISDLSQGTLVAWDSSGGTAYGRVDATSTDGELSSSLRDEPMEGTEDNPAVRVELVDRNEDGDIEGRGETVLHRPGTLSVISEEDVPKSRRPRATTKAGGTVKDVDASSRTVVAHYSVFGVVDDDGDVVHEGAFKQSIKKEGPQGRDRIWKMRDHDWTQRINKPTAIREDGEGLVMETKMPDTRLGNDVLTMYREVGESMEHSVGMMLPEDGTEARKDDGGLDIFQVKLLEGSVVPWGSNSLARMQEMKSDGELAASNVIPRHIKALKDLLSAGITEERKEILHLQLRQMEKEWEALRSTTREKKKAEGYTGDPVNERAEEAAEKAIERLEATSTIDTLISKLN